MKNTQTQAQKYTYAPTQIQINKTWRLMHVTQTHTETGMHSPEHVELSRSKEYPAMHPHLKEPSVLEQVWLQLFLLD